MKKIFAIVIILFIAFVLLLIKPIRTKSVMAGIASQQLEDALYDEFGSARYEAILKELNGPMLTNTEDFTEYTWYKKVGAIDTAKIFIKVYKHPTAFSWRDKFFWNQTNMNYEWNKVD